MASSPPAYTREGARGPLPWLSIDDGIATDGRGGGDDRGHCVLSWSGVPWQMESLAAVSLGTPTYIGYSTYMRTNITISLDPKFIERMDAKRGSMPRSRWLEAAADPGSSAPVIDAPARSPVEIRELDEQTEVEVIPQLDKWGNPVDTVYDETDPRSFA